MMTDRNYPIMIPVKSQSTRCPNKNDVLLPYALGQMAESGRAVYVISDSDRFADVTRQAGAIYVIDDKSTNELEAMLKVAEDIGRDAVFLCPCTTPFRRKGLLEDMERAYRYDHADLVLSARMHTDRSRYFRSDGKWFVPDVERKGCLCKEYEMADGAAYLIRTDFLRYNTDNKGFWNNGKVVTVTNEVPFFVDVDTPRDLDLFRHIINLHKENENGKYLH